MDASDLTGASDPLTGTADLCAGETTKTITVFVADDQLDEVTETLTATLSNPQGSADNPAPTISTATAAVTITDNDAASLAISAAPLTIAEGAVPNTITFTVTRTGNAEGNQSVAYALTGVDASDLTGPATR